jgi:uncharacterized membrane protein
MMPSIRLNKYTGSFLALSIILWETKGMFHSGIPIGLFAATILLIYWLVNLFTGKANDANTSDAMPSIFIALLGIQGVMLFLGLFVDDYDLLHFDTVTRYKPLFQFSIMVFVVGLIYLAYQYSLRKDISTALTALIGIALIIQILAIFCSVTPGIDVFVMLQNACDSLIHLKNPYDSRYPDLYHGIYEQYYGKVNYMTYWPSNVYMGIIFYTLLGDFRYAYIFISICLVWALYRFRTSAGMSRQTVLLFILLWVSNPVLIFTINRGWIDTFTTLPFFLFIYFLKERKLLLSGLFLGLAISFKLYYILLTPLVFLYLTGHFDYTKTARFIAVCCGAFFLTVLPFLIINAGQFYQSTVAYYSGMRLARPDSLSWVSYLTRFNLELVSAGTYFSLLVIGLLYLRFIFGEKSITRFIAFSASVLFIFFMCARQAFCNYYFFILFLYYLAIYFDSPKIYAAEISKPG